MKPGIRVIDQSTVELTIPIILLIGGKGDMKEGTSYEVFWGKSSDDVLCQMEEFKGKLETSLWATDYVDPFEHWVGSSREWIGVVAYYLSEEVVRKLDQPVEELDLPRRVVSVLRGARVMFVWHLCQMNEVEVLHINGIGRWSLMMIWRALQKAGLGLSMKISQDLQKLLNE